MSYLGEQLYAPEGFYNLSSDRRYHFLGIYGEQPRAILCFFEEKTRRGHIDIVPIRVFEDGLQNKKIARCDTQNELPAWLKRLEGKSPEELSKKNSSKRVISDEERVNARFEYIKCLIGREKEIFSAQDPQKTINKIIKDSHKKANQTRIRTWFLTYLCFGRTKWSLINTFKNIGHWEREEKYPDIKFGRVSKHKGKNHGYAATGKVREKIIKGFKRHAKKGRTLKSVYTKSMESEFKCQGRKLDNGIYEIFHPKGEPFPNYNQFHYRIHEQFGKEKVHEILYGEERTRSRDKASRGKQTEHLTNILECLEADAYTVEEIPMCVTHNDTTELLYVVRIRDMISGYFVGIGFSAGSETAEAYRMALFCMAIPKKLFCSYFGLEIDDDEWISQGMPSMGVFDRGPGSGIGLINNFEDRIPIRELGLSYTGQSKATIESSHPRKRHLEGKPSYIKSNKNYIELAQREILRTIADNKGKNISKRMPRHLHVKEFLPCPEFLYKHYDSKMRTNAINMPFQKAVRTFLPMVEFSMRELGAYLYESCFDSTALEKSGLREQVIVRGEYKINGYILPLSLRQAWIENAGELIEVEAKAPVRVNGKLLYVSLGELSMIHEIEKENASVFNDHRDAVYLHYRARFKEKTGKNWESDQRVYGRANKKSPMAKEELINMKKTTSGK